MQNGIRGFLGGTVLLLCPLFFFGCVEQGPTSLPIHNNIEAEKFFVNYFPDDSREIKWLILTGHLDPNFWVNVHYSFVTLNPSYPFCGTYSFAHTGPVPLQRSFEIIMQGNESGEYRVAVPTEYIRAWPLNDFCSWEYSGTIVRLLEKETGKFVDSISLVSMDRIKHVYKGQPLPGKIDLVCSGKEEKRGATGPQIWGCEMELGDDNGRAFGISERYFVPLKFNNSLASLENSLIEINFWVHKSDAYSKVGNSNLIKGVSEDATQ